jgi:hypothetical protein
MQKALIFQLVVVGYIPQIILLGSTSTTLWTVLCLRTHWSACPQVRSGCVLINTDSVMGRITRWTYYLWGYIWKFLDWVAIEISNNKHSWRSNTKGYGDKTHYTDSQNCDTTAPSGRELYHLQFLLQAASPETFGYSPCTGCSFTFWPI